MFCEAVKVDMANSKVSALNNTITTTLSLITVLFEDLFEVITIQKEFCGRKLDPKPSISLLNKTNTFDGYDFTTNIFEDEVNVLKKELLMLFEAYCAFGYREFYKNKLLEIFVLSSPGIRNHMNWQVGTPDPEFPQSYQTILHNQEFIIHNSATQPVQYSLSKLPTMATIYDKP